MAESEHVKRGPRSVCVEGGGGGGGGGQLLSLEFSEIDLLLLHLTCGSRRPVSAQLRVSYQNITHSIQNFTS